MHILALYMRDICRTPLLSAEAERSLLVRAKGGDKEARDILVKSNLPMVVATAKKYGGLNIPLVEELIGEGNLALVEAVEKFDLKAKNKFMAYAIWWVWQRIMRYLREDERLIKPPQNILFAKQKLQAGMSPEEITKKYYVSKNALKYAQMFGETYSLSDIVGKDVSEDITYEDVIGGRDPGFDDVDGQIFRDYLLYLMRAYLTAREQEILMISCGFDERYTGMSLEDLGRKFNVSKERIRQIRLRALRKIKPYINQAA